MPLQTVKLHISKVVTVISFYLAGLFCILCTSNVLSVWLCLQREDMILTVPNVLTLSRMLMAPVLGYLVVANSYTMACIVFTVAGATDLVSVR